AQPKQDRLQGSPGVDARASGRLGWIKRGDDRADAGPEGVGDLPDGGQVFGPRRRFAGTGHAGLLSRRSLPPVYPHRAFEIVSKSVSAGRVGGSTGGRLNTRGRVLERAGGGAWISQRLGRRVGRQQGWAHLQRLRARM